MSRFQARGKAQRAIFEVVDGKRHLEAEWLLDEGYRLRVRVDDDFMIGAPQVSVPESVEDVGRDRRYIKARRVFDELLGLGVIVPRKKAER